MKKIFSIVSLALWCIAAWADGFEKDGLYYVIENEMQVTVTSFTSPSGEVTVPEFVTNNEKTYMVTKITGPGWSDVTKLNLPKSLTEIDEQCFYGAEKLEYINWSDLISLQTIGARAFTYSGIKDVILTFNVQTIGENAFSGCEALTNVTFQTVALKELSDNIFAGCTKLTSIDLFASYIQKIGEGTFFGCSALKTVKLPVLNLKEIGKTAFAGCTSMTDFTIPQNVTTLGDRFLAWNTKLKTLTTQASTPRTATSDTFDGIDKGKVTLVVPKGTVHLYKNANGWKEFEHITDGTQAIENVSNETFATIKYISNGQVFILCGDKTYTLQGQEAK